MIDLDISVDSSDLAKWEIFTEKQKKSALKIVAGEGMRIMRERVKRGENLDGGTFKDYDPDYEDRKQRAGRMGEGYWLRLSGWMWRTQKAFIERVGDVLRAVLTFEGMRPSVSFTDPAKASAYKRAARSERGGFEGIWRKKEGARRSRHRKKWEAAPRSQRGGMKESAKRRLTVNIDSGDMVSSATVAEANDRIRPFIGFNQREADHLAETFSEALDKVSKS